MRTPIQALILLGEKRLNECEMSYLKKKKKNKRYDPAWTKTQPERFDMEYSAKTNGETNIPHEKESY